MCDNLKARIEMVKSKKELKKELTKTHELLFEGIALDFQGLSRTVDQTKADVTSIKKDVSQILVRMNEEKITEKAWAYDKISGALSIKNVAFIGALILALMARGESGWIHIVGNLFK